MTTDFDRWLADWSKWRSGLTGDSDFPEPLSDTELHQQSATWRAIYDWCNENGCNYLKAGCALEITIEFLDALLAKSKPTDQLRGDSGTSMDDWQVFENPPLDFIVQAGDEWRHRDAGKWIECDISVGKSLQYGFVYHDKIQIRRRIQPALPADFACIPEASDEFRAGDWVVSDDYSTPLLQRGKAYQIAEVKGLEIFLWTCDDDTPYSYMREYFRRASPDEIPQAANERPRFRLRDGVDVKYDNCKFVLLVQMQGKTDCKSFDVKYDAEKFGVDMLIRHDKRVFLSDECWMCCGVECGSPEEVLEEWQSQLEHGECYRVLPVIHNAKFPDELHDTTRTPADAQPTLQLREGAWYERRDGEKVGPAMRSVSSVFPWTVGNGGYKSDGRYNDSGIKSKLDLIREDIPSEVLREWWMENANSPYFSESDGVNIPIRHYADKMTEKTLARMLWDVKNSRGVK